MTEVDKLDIIRSMVSDEEGWRILAMSIVASKKPEATELCKGMLREIAADDLALADSYVDRLDKCIEDVRAVKD